MLPNTQYFLSYFLDKIKRVGKFLQTMHEPVASSTRALNKKLFAERAFRHVGVHLKNRQKLQRNSSVLDCHQWGGLAMVWYQYERSAYSKRWGSFAIPCLEFSRQNSWSVFEAYLYSERAEVVGQRIYILKAKSKIQVVSMEDFYSGCICGG